METLDPSAEAAANSVDPVARVRALNELAVDLARNGQTEPAFVHVRQAREIASRLDNRQLDAETRHAQARCHFYVADFMPALEHLLESARLYQEAGDPAGAAAAFAGVGLCQHRLGAQDDAAASLLRALQAARDQNLQELEINICNSLGSTLIEANRVDEAARYLARGVELAQATGNRGLLTKLLLNQSHLTKRHGDFLVNGDAAAAQAEYVRSLAQASMALALAREQANPYDELQCLGQSGTMQRLLNDHAEAEATLGRTIALARELGEPHIEAEALTERGYLCIAQGRLEHAGAALAEAIGIARRTGIRAVLAEACEAASMVLERCGDFAGALAMYKEFHAVRETELAGSRKHAAHAAQLWLDFQDASHRARQFQARAESLAADHAALTLEAQVLVEVSQQDPLTGLLNRRGLDERIGTLVAGSEVNSLPLTIALIDVDLFKRINDTFSHAVGDTVLRRVAAIIREHSRQNDLPVRYGGDEFLLVLANATTETGMRVLQRLKEAIDTFPWEAEATGLKVTLSIGIATRGIGATIATTIAAADRALYDAKAAGRDRIAIRR